MRWNLGEREGREGGGERDSSRERGVIKQEVIHSVTESRYTEQYKEQ